MWLSAQNRKNPSKARDWKMEQIQEDGLVRKEMGQAEAHPDALAIQYCVYEQSPGAFQGK